MLVTALVVIAIFAVLILVHELGHFFAAKRAGIRVDELGLGFPPRLFSIKRGETIYSLNAIPLGGFVRLFGEEGEGKGDPGSFISQAPGKRARVLVMGVVMNFILAYLIIAALMFAKTPLYVGQPSDYPGVTVQNQAVEVQSVIGGSPAEESDLRPGDAITAIDSVPVGDVQVAIRLLRERAGAPIQLEIRRGGEAETVSTTLRPADEDRGVLGAELRQIQEVNVPIWEIPIVALVETVRLVWAIIEALGKLLAGLIVDQAAPSGLAGPVGIAALIQKVLEFGAIPLLRLTAVLSLSLAVFNILPIPALDGGRLVFLVVEKGLGRRVKASVENAVHVAGFWFLILLIIAISAYDVYRLITGKFGF